MTSFPPKKEQLYFDMCLSSLTARPTNTLVLNAVEHAGSILMEGNMFLKENVQWKFLQAYLFTTLPLIIPTNTQMYFYIFLKKKLISNT